MHDKTVEIEPRLIGNFLVRFLSAVCSWGFCWDARLTQAQDSQASGWKIPERLIHYEFRKKLTERDQVLIYYAGHGFLEPPIDRGYWIPIKGDLQDNSEWIEIRRLPTCCS